MSSSKMVDAFFLQGTYITFDVCRIPLLQSVTPEDRKRKKDSEVFPVFTVNLGQTAFVAMEELWGDCLWGAVFLLDVRFSAFMNVPLPTMIDPDGHEIIDPICPPELPRELVRFVNSVEKRFMRGVPVLVILLMPPETILPTCGSIAADMYSYFERLFRILRAPEPLWAVATATFAAPATLARAMRWLAAGDGECQLSAC